MMCINNSILAVGVEIICMIQLTTIGYHSVSGRLHRAHTSGYFSVLIHHLSGTEIYVCRQLFIGSLIR